MLEVIVLVARNVSVPNVPPVAVVPSERVASKSRSPTTQLEPFLKKAARGLSLRKRSHSWGFNFLCSERPRKRFSKLSVRQVNTGCALLRGRVPGRGRCDTSHRTYQNSKPEPATGIRRGSRRPVRLAFSRLQSYQSALELAFRIPEEKLVVR